MPSHPPTSPEMRAVIAEACAIFQHHPPPTGTLHACTDCCLPPEMERELRTLPLARLTDEHFYSYNTAAKSSVQPAPELLYLLPRLLEPLAEGAEVHLSIEPPAIFEGDVYAAKHLPRVPCSLAEAIETFKSSPFIARTFGADVAAHYTHFFETERDSFHRAVTDWERRRYFERI